MIEKLDIKLKIIKNEKATTTTTEATKFLKSSLRIIQPTPPDTPV
jgi:hypothetical protein